MCHHLQGKQEELVFRFAKMLAAKGHLHFLRLRFPQSHASDPEKKAIIIQGLTLPAILDKKILNRMEKLLEVPKGCFLEIFSFKRRTTKHPYAGAGRLRPMQWSFRSSHHQTLTQAVSFGLWHLPKKSVVSKRKCAAKCAAKCTELTSKFASCKWNCQASRNLVTRPAAPLGETSETETAGPLLSRHHLAICGSKQGPYSAGAVPRCMMLECLEFQEPHIIPYANPAQQMQRKGLRRIWEDSSLASSLMYQPII